MTRQNSSEVSSAPSPVAGVHGVLDDPHGDRRPVGLAARVQLGQVGAVGQHSDRGQPERRRGPPQDVRPGGQHVAGQGVGQEVPVGQHEHSRAERAQQVAGQGLLADRVGAQRGPDQRPGPGLGRDQPADLGERPVPGRVGRAAEVLGILAGVGQVAGRAVQRDHPQPTAEHPGHAVGADRAGDRLEQHPQRIGSQPGPRPSQRGDGRRAPPPTRAGVDPAVRIEAPVEQLPSTAAVIQPVDQLAQHPRIAAVAAPEQPQRQHEVDNQPGRQQPTPHLAGVGGLHHLIDQPRRERLRQRPHRHPVGQPPVRRHSLRTVMPHPAIIAGDDHQITQPARRVTPRSL